jgi:hypothetical protein
MHFDLAATLHNSRPALRTHQRLTVCTRMTSMLKHGMQDQCWPDAAGDMLIRDAQYVDFGSVQRTVRVQYAVRCLVRCLYAAVKGTCNVLVKVSLEVTY